MSNPVRVDIKRGVLTERPEKQTVCFSSLEDAFAFLVIQEAYDQIVVRVNGKFLFIWNDFDGFFYSLMIKEAKNRLLLFPPVWVTAQKG